MFCRNLEIGAREKRKIVEDPKWDPPILGENPKVGAAMVGPNREEKKFRISFQVMRRSLAKIQRGGKR